MPTLTEISQAILPLPSPPIWQRLLDYSQDNDTDNLSLRFRAVLLDYEASIPEASIESPLPVMRLKEAARALTFAHCRESMAELEDYLNKVGRAAESLSSEQVAEEPSGSESELQETAICTQRQEQAFDSFISSHISDNSAEIGTEFIDLLAKTFADGYDAAIWRPDAVKTLTMIKDQTLRLAMSRDRHSTNLGPGGFQAEFEMTGLAVSFAEKLLAAAIQLERKE